MDLTWRIAQMLQRDGEREDFLRRLEIEGILTMTTVLQTPLGSIPQRA